MKKITFYLLAAGLIVTGLRAAAQDALSATVSKLDNARTVKELETLGNQFAALGNEQKTNWLPFYYAALCNAKIGFLYQDQEDDGEKIEPYSNQGEAYAKQAQSLLGNNPGSKDKAELYAVLSMVYRTKVFINPATYGRKYGPVSQQYLDQALQLDPQNPRALYLQGWVKYYAPKMWGGDKDKAREYLQQSLQELQKQPATGTQPRWGKAECEALLKKYK